MSDTPQDNPQPMPLPSEGGTYERQPDGSLKRLGQDETPPPAAKTEEG